MPEVNLAALSGPELRRLLDATRERGDAALSYQILKEMAARRERGPGLSFLRRPAEPRIVSVDLGDPAAREDDLPPTPTRRPAPGADAARAQASPTPEPRAAAPAPRARRAKPHAAPAPAPAAESTWPADDFAPAARPQMEAPAVESPSAPGRRRPTTLAAAALGAAVGAAAGVAVGWFLGGIGHPPQPAPAAAPQHVVTAASERRPPPAQPVEARQAPPEVAAPPPQTGAPPAPEPPQAPPAGRTAHAGLAPQAARERPDRPAAKAGACAAEPTPADRAICAQPRLRRLQRELRLAYAEALAAHRDKARLRERQLAWRDARNAIADPARLAVVYEQRIQKLKAATADARRRR